MALSQEELDRLAALDAALDNRGDAWEPPRPVLNGKPAAPKEEKPRWPAPVPVSQLPEHGPVVDWILNGMIAKGHLTLLSAFFKAGKTTFTSHLLKCLQHGVPFIGRETRECRTLYVSEESAAIWRGRRDALFLDDHLHLLCRPMFAKPSFPEWREFISYLAEISIGNYDLVIFDTMSAFAPWRNENDSAEVAATFMPFNELMEAGLAVGAWTHFGKNEGNEGRSTRGSTAIGAAVDILLELRRHKPDDLEDRRRVINGLGRFDEIPVEVVIALADDGSGFVAEGDKKALAARELHEAILAALGVGEDNAATAEVIHGSMAEEDRPKLRALMRALKDGAHRGHWKWSGEGKKGDPYKYWKNMVS